MKYNYEQSVQAQHWQTGACIPVHLPFKVCLSNNSSAWAGLWIGFIAFIMLYDDDIRIEELALCFILKYDQGDLIELQS